MESADGATGRSRAPWVLKALRASLKDKDEEMMTLVGTPEGGRWVPFSEAKDKVNLYEQLPEENKRIIARKLFEEYRKWRLEQESCQGEKPSSIS